MDPRRFSVSVALLAIALVGAVLSSCVREEGSAGPDATPSGEQSTGSASPTPESPTRARTPAEVVDQIVEAERAIADPESSRDELADAGRLQQLAYLELGIRPEWDRRVRKALPADLVSRVRANVASRRELASMHTGKPSSDLPAWRIVRPPPARVLLRSYREAEREFGVDWEFLAAINLVETGMGRIRGTSVAGARGPMQFIPETWAAYGEGAINSPHDSILAAARYLDARGFSTPGGRDDALYGYNNHPAYVRGVTHLAEVMQRHPRAFFGYHQWEVYFFTTRGHVRLPVGYAEKEPVPVRSYLSRMNHD